MVIIQNCNNCEQERRNLQLTIDGVQADLDEIRHILEQPGLSEWDALEKIIQIVNVR